MRKGAAGGLLRAPSPLFQPEGCDEGAPGASGGDWSEVPQGFRRSEAAGCAETAAAESAGWRVGVVLAGIPQFPASQRPRSTCCLGLAMFPRAPRLRPPLVSALLGAL